MSELRKAAEQALNTLQSLRYRSIGPDVPDEAINALRAALAEPEQSEPVAAIHIGWDYLDNGKMVATYAVPVNEQVAPKLYAVPPRREPLIAKEILKLVPFSLQHITDGVLVGFARAIEQAHGITGEKT